MSDYFNDLRSLMAEGRHEDAELSVAGLTKDSLVWVEASRILAFKYFEGGRLDRSLQAVERVLEGSPNMPWALHLDVRLARARRNIAGQMRSLKRLNTLFPNDISVAAAYADWLVADGRPEAAAKIQENLEHWRVSDIERLPKWQEASASVPSRYLDLLEKTICNIIYGDAIIQSQQLAAYAEERRLVGRDVPSQAHSMIGLQRLHQLRRAVEAVVDEGVPGDLIETGVWRGGACILMRGVLAERGISDRSVIVADSFAGLPPPDPRYAQDALTTFDFHKRSELAVSIDDVRANFKRYDLLDEQVVFLEGLFRDSLPTLPDRPLALLRLDGDLYSSTMDALEVLYDRVSQGGFIIIDDYGPIIDCRRAVLDFRGSRGIETPMTAVDGDAIFWRKE